MKYCSNYLNWLQFPNSKNNSFQGNYIRKYGMARGHKENGCYFKKDLVPMRKSVQRCLYVCVLLDCCYVSFRWFTNNCYYFCIACGFKDLVTSERTVGKVFQLLTRYILISPRLWSFTGEHPRLKSSISTHSKLRMRLFKCFVLIILCCKTKHLRSLVWGIIQGFEWVEILGLSTL